MNKMKKTNFDSYIEREIKKNPKLKNELTRAGVAIDVSMQIYELRKSRDMTQAELAKLTGVKQSNIARLERADYEGYSLKTLNKVARALKTRLKIYLQPINQKKQTKVVFNYIIYYSAAPSYQLETSILNEEPIGIRVSGSEIGETFKEEKKVERTVFL